MRAWRREHGELKRGQIIETERGPKDFAAGDRLYFLRNERSPGVKNGSLGTIQKVRDGVLEVDATGDRVVVDTKFYRDLDYGYAATVYKAQGATVDHLRARDLALRPPRHLRRAVTPPALGGSVLCGGGSSVALGKEGS